MQIPQTIIQAKRNYDEACKKVLSLKCIQAILFKDVLKECEDLSIEEIIQSIEPTREDQRILGFNVEDESIPGARIYFDLLFLVRYKGKLILIDLEAQSSPVSYDLFNRALYYGCRLIDRQKSHPLGFHHSDFDDLIPVLTLWL